MVTGIYTDTHDLLECLFTHDSHIVMVNYSCNEMKHFTHCYVRLYTLSMEEISEKYFTI